jgi:hypothetical protein
MRDLHDILNSDHTAPADRDLHLCAYDLSKAQIQSYRKGFETPSSKNPLIQTLKTTASILQKLRNRGPKATNSPYLPHRAPGFVQQDFNRCCH